MTKETLERLLNEACELLIIFEDGTQPMKMIKQGFQQYLMK